MGDRNSKRIILRSDKECLGKIAAALARRKWTHKEINTMFSECGYAVPPRTIGSWIKNVEERGSVLNPAPLSGKSSILSAEQKSYLAGFILREMEVGKTLTVKDIQQVILVEMGKTVAIRTIREYLNDLDISL